MKEVGALRIGLKVSLKLVWSCSFYWFFIYSEPMWIAENNQDRLFICFLPYIFVLFLIISIWIWDNCCNLTVGFPPPHSNPLVSRLVVFIFHIQIKLGTAVKKPPSWFHRWPKLGKDLCMFLVTACIPTDGPGSVSLHICTVCRQRFVVKITKTTKIRQP